MQPVQASMFAIGLLIGAGLSLWIAIRELRRTRENSLQTEASWPFEFSVYWLDYYLGPKLARICLVGQVAAFFPMFLLGAVDALAGEGKYVMLMSMNMVGFCGATVFAFSPLTCRFDEKGIRFQQQFYPWETIRRWNVNERRLQLLTARSTNRTLQITLEIPLNGLSQALGPWLNEQIAEHVSRNSPVLN